ncbi:MAG: nitroreductase family deazaflavin-dependent oxidoreductase [Anaerolineae bacterium]
METPLTPNVRVPSGWRRLILPLAWSKPGSWLFARLMHLLDRPVLRWTHGRSSVTSLLAGLPIISLTTTGAKSGQPRTVPLVAVEDGERLVVFASNFGQAHYPAWYHNLRAHPQARVLLRGQERVYLARETEGAERDAYWAAAVKLYPGYQAYKVRTGGRPIPVIVLTPVTSTV